MEPSPEFLQAWKQELCRTSPHLTDLLATHYTELYSMHNITCEQIKSRIKELHNRSPPQVQADVLQANRSITLQCQALSPIQHPAHICATNIDLHPYHLLLIHVTLLYQPSIPWTHTNNPTMPTIHTNIPIPISTTTNTTDNVLGPSIGDPIDTSHVQEPTKGPELFMDARQVFYATRNYEGQARVPYNQVYRHQATSRHSLDWSQKDQALYIMRRFTRWAKQAIRCKHCLSEHHSVNLQFAVKLPFIIMQGNKQLAHLNKQCKITCACLSHS